MYNIKTWTREKVILRQELYYDDQMIALHDMMVPFKDADTIQEVTGSADELKLLGSFANKKNIHNIIENTLVTHAKEQPHTDDQ